MGDMPQTIYVEFNKDGNIPVEIVGCVGKDYGDPDDSRLSAYIRADLAAERERRLASAEDIHALADRLHESGLHKASVHARSLAHELERKSSETP